jgi:hypothetical protein
VSGSMADGDIVSGPALKELAEWLISVAWPVSEAQMMDLTHERGWAVTSADIGEGADWDTGLVGSRPWASAIVIDGVMTQLSLATAEIFQEDTAESLGFLRDIFVDQVEVLTGVAGPPAIRRPGVNPAAIWDLPNGSSLTLGLGGGTCFWVLKSPKTTEVDRRLGR